MKPLFYTKTLIALAVAVVAAAAMVSQAQEQPIPPPANESNLPPNIAPDSPEAEVVKLMRADMDIGVIKTFIANSAKPFNLDAEKILALTDLGMPTDLVNAMLDHDKALAVPAAAPVSTTTIVTAAPTVVATAPPTEPVTETYFQETLSPYGSWVEVEGYGRCWRPTAVVYDSGWQPYRERGHWVYSDCGWYWDSEYSWGVTFHYGRWFRHDRFGWCWWPDTVWAPSWVTWRSNDDYCGWAPLPPFTVYRPGGGFYYRGANVAIGFDFGLSVGCFTFVSPSHFCAPHPRYYCLDSRRSAEIFHHTTIINNFSSHREGGHRDVVVNAGFSVDRFNRFNHHPIQPVHIGDIRNAQRQGWRDNDRPEHPRNGGAPGGRTEVGGGGPQHHDAGSPTGRNNDGKSRPGSGQSTPGGPQNNQHNGPADRNDRNDRNPAGQPGAHNPVTPSAGAPLGNNSGATAGSFNRGDQGGRGFGGQDRNPSTPSAGAPLGNNSGATAGSFNRGDQGGRGFGGLNRNPSTPSVGAPSVSTPSHSISPQRPANPGQNDNHSVRSDRPQNGQSGFGLSPGTTLPGNKSSAGGATFNQAGENNRVNTYRPTSPGGAAAVTAPPRVVQQQSESRAPVRSVQPNNPPQTRATERPAITAPVQRSQPQVEQRQTRVETPRQSVAPAAAPRSQPAAAAQPRSSDQSSGRSSDRDKGH